MTKLEDDEGHREPIRTFVVAFKTVAFISFILGLCLLSISFWILIAFTERAAPSDTPTASNFRLLTILVNNANKNDKQRKDYYVDDDNIEIDNTNTNFNNTSSDPELKELQRKFVYAWNSVSPYFQGACGLAVILGLVQVVLCLAILISSTKGASKPFRSSVWMILHCVLIILFLICILIPVSIDKSLQDGGISHHLEALSIQLKKKRGYHDNNESVLDTEDVDNMTLLYIALMGDAIGCVLVVVGYLVMVRLRKDVK